MINRQLKAVLTHAWEKLGPDRVALALADTAPPSMGDGWSFCFLARAYGPPEALWRQARCLGTTPELLMQEMFGVADFYAVMQSWDYYRDDFRALAAEWLESNRVPADSETVGHSRSAGAG